MHPEKFSFKFNEIKCIASVYFFFFNSQLVLVVRSWVRKFTNFEINMTREFLLLTGKHL